jgi:DNA-binding XRE family transcriptional regulator
MTDPRTSADYLRIASTTDTIVVCDRDGHRSTFETLNAFELFAVGVSARRLSLYDDTSGRWMVGTIDQLDDAGIDWPERLRAVRKARALTQGQMADVLGYSHASHVAALESGKLTITPMLERLIAALEASSPHLEVSA